MRTGNPPSALQAVFDAAAPAARMRLHDLRAMILEEAERLQVGPLTETLKWGEPAFLTETSKAGTTIRLGWRPADPDHIRLLVNCRTDLIDRYKARFGDLFAYEGNRAIRLAVDEPVQDGALRSCIGLALTYRRDRR
jgi:hypothetical protein